MSLIVKEINKYEDFKKVIKIFQQPPFNEILTEEDMINEFQSYIDNGYALGCYDKEDILGFIGILKGLQHNHPVSFENPDNVLYVNGITVLNEHRNRGVGTKLLESVLDKVMETDDFDTMYFRTNNENSMFEPIAAKHGFEVVTKDGEVVTQDVEFDRIDPNAPKTDKRKFLTKKFK